MVDRLKGKESVFRLESELQGGEQGAGTDAEDVFRPGEGSVGHILISAFIQQVVGGQR